MRRARSQLHGSVKLFSDDLADVGSPWGRLKVRNSWQPNSRRYEMRFTKMHGAGNDYIYVDGFRHELPAHPDQVAKLVSDRHTGIGADGLILICPSEVADAEMRMFNADGSRSEMCGNGVRCVAKYLRDHGIVTKTHMQIETLAGIIDLEVLGQESAGTMVRVDMGKPILAASLVPTLLIGDPNHGDRVVDVPFDIDGDLIRGTCVSMGNPHCVVYCDEQEDVVHRLGPKIENDDRFPSRVNVEFVTVLSKTEVRQRTWERGSGETMACGTGASAVCVAGVLTGKTERELTCHLLGGTLRLNWDEASDHIFMTGPAVEVYSGEIALT